MHRRARGVLRPGRQGRPRPAPLHRAPRPAAPRDRLAASASGTSGAKPVIFRDLVDPRTELPVGLDNLDVATARGRAVEPFVELKGKLRTLRGQLEAAAGDLDRPQRRRRLPRASISMPDPGDQSLWQEPEGELEARAQSSGPASLPRRTATTDPARPGRQQQRQRRGSTSCSDGVVLLRGRPGDWIRAERRGRRPDLDRRCSGKRQREFPGRSSTASGAQSRSPQDYKVPRLDRRTARSWRRRADPARSACQRRRSGAVTTSATVRADAAPSACRADPYPGLRPFEPDEWPIFFGREAMCDEVHRPPRRAAPRRRPRRLGLRQVLARPRRRPALARPRPRPQRQGLEERRYPAPERRAACATSRARSPGSSAPRPARRGGPATAWHDRLALGRSVLADIEQALAAQGGASLCVLIDQFEELFRYAREHSREEAALARRPPLRPRRPRAAPRPAPVRHPDHALRLPRRLRPLRGLRRGGQPLPVPPAAHGRLRPPARDPRARHPLRRHRRPRRRRPPPVRRPRDGGRAPRPPARPHARRRPRPRARRPRALDRHPRRPPGRRGPPGRPLPARRGGPGRGHRRRPGPAQGGRVAVPQPHRPRRRRPRHPPPDPPRRPRRRRRRRAGPPRRARHDRGLPRPRPQLPHPLPAGGR